MYVWWQSKLNLTKPETVSGLNGNESLFFASTTNEVESFVENRLSSLEESSHFYRFQKHQSPIFKPDFKAGNFFTRDDFVRRASLLTTISDLTKGMRRPVWFLSDIYQSSLKSLTDAFSNYAFLLPLGLLLLLAFYFYAKSNVKVQEKTQYGSTSFIGNKRWCF